MGKGGGENLFQNAKAYIKNVNNILHMRNQNPATNVTSFFNIIWIEKRINHALLNKVIGGGASFVLQ